MVYMDDDVLGWQPLAEAWLNERNSPMERKVGLRGGGGWSSEGICNVLEVCLTNQDSNVTI